MGYKPELWEGSLTYTQDSDCCQSEGLTQSITISSHDSGNGRFLTVQTERWAVDKPEELAELITEAAKRLEVDASNVDELLDKMNCG